MPTSTPMQLGMVGLGRMGAGLVGRLMRDGHSCVVYDVNPAAVTALEKEGATGSTSMAEFVEKLTQPRAAWVMVPAGEITAKTITDLASHLSSGDIIIDGGNTYYRDDIRHAKTLSEKGIHHIDCGTSGGVWGIDRGFCLMIGGEDEIVAPSPAHLRHHRPGSGHRAREPRGGRVNPTMPNWASCTAVPTAPATSSRWSTTGSSTA